ncbi:M15 family metallopeptidase [Alteromonas sp. 1_MG-2023]|uniref:M15 family metallopeptidase n=1 Tax=Alteromonas sp. 1_MG-2023 TaxID=3062669 RepID=UPI0026E1E90E|nr:M15 family metallopeptidase [Alteromonas sp. 1_MG-2023]MDO6567429.1 M15 family metallopeptidase [Alteromonas sp. 1_MG-2023]
MHKAPMSAANWLGQDNTYLVDAGNGHFLHPEVLSAFNKMQQAARGDGIDLCLVSSFRHFEKQCAIWNRKWRGEAALLDNNGTPLNPKRLSDVEKLHSILMWSALPGGSRHHWGSDFDVYDKHAVEQWSGKFSLVDSEYCEGGPCFALAQWLEVNMSTFGFFRPFREDKGGVACERWHLSHKVVAAEFEQARSLASLISAIGNSNIEGKAVVLSHIDEIYYRYILNRGVNYKR